MNTLLEKINKIPKDFFSLKDLQKISQLNKTSLPVLISRAIKSGHLIKLKNGLYAKYNSDISLNQLAMYLYNPSYISFETALGQYNILSQKTSITTLATTKRHKEITSANNIFIYHHIKKDLFWGYKKEDNYLIAEPEKAFLDLAYLSLNGYGHFDIEEMNLKILNKSRLKTYLKKINQPKLTDKISKILK